MTVFPAGEQQTLDFNGLREFLSSLDPSRCDPPTELEVIALMVMTVTSISYSLFLQEQIKDIIIIVVLWDKAQLELNNPALTRAPQGSGPQSILDTHTVGWGTFQTTKHYHDRGTQSLKPRPINLKYTVIQSTVTSPESVIVCSD